MKKRKNIVQYSVMYLVLAVNVVSIVVLSIFNYFAFTRKEQKIYRESFISYSQNVNDIAFRNLVQQIVNPIYNISTLYFSDIEQNKPVLLPQEENIKEGKTEQIRELVKSLEEIRYSHPNIQSLDIYYEKTNTVVTGFSHVHFPMDEEELNHYLPWYQEFLGQDQDYYFMAESEKVYPLYKPVLTYVKRIRKSSWGDRGIVIAIHIPSSVFSEYIDENAGRLNVYSADGRLLYETSAEKKAWETPFYYESDEMGLSFVYYMDDQILYKDVQSKNQLFLMNFLISIGFNVLLLFGISYYSSHIYQKKLIAITKETGVSISQDSKNFDTSLKQLKEEIITLHETASSSRDLRFQSSVRALILGRERENSWNILKNKLEYERCQILMWLNNRIIGEREAIEQLQQHIGLWEQELGIHILFTTMERGELILILNFPKTKEQKVTTDVIERIGQYSSNGSIIVGTVYDSGYETIQKAYGKICEAAQYRYIFSKSIIRQDDLHIDKRKESGSHLKLFEKIEKDVNSENYLEFKLHLEQLIESFKSGNYTIRYCISTLRDLVTLFCRMIERRNLDMWVIYGYDLREYYKQITDIDTFQNWMNDICEVLLNNIIRKRKAVDEDGDLKEKLTVLIEDNLENDISLDYLSDILSMRPDVLSRTFKQVMGEGYAEYVKKKKLDWAIRLMEDDYSVKEIAERLGYSSPQYFIKIFKEQYGTTPFQYRKNRKNS